MTRMEQLRKLKDFSKAELARRAGMHASDIGKIESRRLMPYGSQLQRIADAVGYEDDLVNLLDLIA